MKQSRSQDMRSKMGCVRIIGGRWRNTRLSVPQLPDLRPSSDRVRETLFNWLAPWLPTLQVLDLFAGSGALGIEAVSRGARRAVLIEREDSLCSLLRERVTHLQASAYLEVIHGDALAWLLQPPTQLFDLVFCDPPFQRSLWEQVNPVLLTHLSETAWVYIESPAAHPAAPPMGCRLHRQASTAQVHFALYRYNAVRLGTVSC